MSTQIDYINTCFAHPVLTKITSKPTYSSLKILKDELKANAASVPSDLGGGKHGHLGLVLKDDEYKLVSVSMVHKYLGYYIMSYANTNNKSIKIIFYCWYIHT